MNIHLHREIKGPNGVYAHMVYPLSTLASPPPLGTSIRLDEETVRIIDVVYRFDNGLDVPPTVELWLSRDTFWYDVTDQQGSFQEMIDKYLKKGWRHDQIRET